MFRALRITVLGNAKQDEDRRGDVCCRKHLSFTIADAAMQLYMSRRVNEK